METPTQKFAARNQRSEPISRRDKIYQGLGSIPDGIKDFAFRTFLLIYYNQVLGLPATTASAALFVALIFDAISDPLVGSFSDNLRHKWGRRHPLMAAASLPLTICIYFLFAPPEFLVNANGTQDSYLFFWLLFFAVTTRLSLTFFSVPWNALFAEMSDDYKERSELISYRFAVIWVFSPFFIYSVYAFIFTSTETHPLGQLNPANYPPFAMALALVVGLGAFITTALTWKQIPYLKHPITEDQRFSLSVLIRDLRMAMSNPEFRTLFFVILANAIVTGTSQALQIYMNSYFWGFSGEQMRWLALSVVGGLIAFLTVVPLQSWLDKKYLLICSAVITTLASAFPVSLVFLGLAPPSGSTELVALIVVITAISAFCVTIAITMVASMLADTLDLQELQTGTRQEGLFNSVITFSSKATNGLGLLVSGLLIDFVVRLPENAALSEVTETMVWRLGVLEAYVVPAFNIVWMLLVLRYGITKARYLEIRQTLDSRQKQL